jgi:selenocysteine lyase/cysteine desulfurase
VLRPLKYLSESADVEVTYLPCDAEGYVHADKVQQALQPNTRLVAVIHGSNVTGAIQPISDIGEVVCEHDAYFLVDAAQTLGEVPITMGGCHADLIAAPGHKGLLGPLGTGVLCLSERVVEKLRPLRFGGTGTSSEFDRQPTDLPHK